MLRRTLIVSAGAALLLTLAAPGLYSQRKKKNEEPKPQVLPLPPELPMALAAETETLDFHISPLLRSGGLGAQIRQSLGDLIRDTHGETIVKLRAFVAGAGDARRVQAEAADLFTEHKLPLPVLSVLQVGGLGDEAAKVIIEAVVSTHRAVNPHGLAFVAGQNGVSLKDAVDKLAGNVKAAGVAPESLLTTTCFTSGIENYAATRASLLGVFPNTSVNVVQALRDPPNDASMCEAVGQLSQNPASDVVWLNEKRTALVNSRRLIFTGLQLTFGSFLDDAQQAFQRLQHAAKALGSTDVAIQVNAFSINAYAGSALRKSTSFPASTFTIQRVEGLPAIDASAGIEAVLAPDVAAPREGTDFSIPHAK
jgi:hypothetical protein